MTNLRERLKGMFWGVAIGDALGIAYECRDYPYGDVTDLPDAPFCSDDTQLTLAVANALIESKGYDIETQKVHHISAFTESTFGWGHSTRAGIGGLMGIRYERIPTGIGNGIAMKVSPLSFAYRKGMPDDVKKQFVEFSAITHPTSVAISSGFASFEANRYCLTTQKFVEEEFLKVVLEGSEEGKKYFPETLKEDITEQLKKVGNYKTADFPTIINDFGKGSPFVYNSLPFSYAFFLRNPHSVKSMFEVVSAGGDTDTNASIVGGMLGALNGPEIFPQYLKDKMGKSWEDCIEEFTEILYKLF